MARQGRNPSVNLGLSQVLGSAVGIAVGIAIGIAIGMFGLCVNRNLA